MKRVEIFFIEREGGGFRPYLTEAYDVTVALTSERLDGQGINPGTFLVPQERCSLVRRLIEEATA